MPPKAQSRRRNRNEIKPLSGLDVNALLGTKPKKPKITPENPIPEFRQALDVAKSHDAFVEAAHQIGSIIETRIKDSFGDVNYNRAIEELGVMREEMIEMESPMIWNEYIEGLKGKLLGDELGGDRREMWWEVKKNKLGLIERKSSERSSVTEEEAKAFLSRK